MTDEEHRELFHGLALRLERFDARLEALDKRVSEGFAQINTRLEGLEHRLNTKAGNWVVGLWGSTLMAAIAGGVALVLKFH